MPVYDSQMTARTISRALQKYSSCDISDALLKLRHPYGGFLPGLSMWSPTRQEGDTRIVGPAYTVKFARNGETDAPTLAQHHIDTIPDGAVVFLSAPAGVFNAVYGGLMSHRAKYSGAVGTIIDGNFRDLQEHRDLGYPIFARNVATPPYYEVAHPVQVDVPVKFQSTDLDVSVSPGDYIVADLNGVVCVPQDLASQILEMLPAQTQADEMMAEAISRGSTFQDASKTYRKK